MPFKALQIADRAYVLEQGRIVKEGHASEVAQDPQVKEAYLGSRSRQSGRDTQRSPRSSERV